MFDTLEIFLGGKCNFDCQYCELKNISKKNLDDDEINARLQKIKNYSRIIKKIEVLGGEPLIFKYLEDIININTNLNILINTNLFRPFDYKTQNNISLNATFHPEFIKIEKFCENIHKSKFNSLEIVIMSSDDAIEYYNYFSKRFTKTNIYIESILNLKNKKYDLKYMEYSKIQNIINNFMNMKQGFILNNLPAKKVCKRKQLTFNFIENKIYKCLTRMYYQNTDMGDLCGSDVCFCDVDKIKDNN